MAWRKTLYAASYRAMPKPLRCRSAGEESFFCMARTKSRAGLLAMPSARCTGQAFATTDGVSCATSCTSQTWQGFAALLASDVQGAVNIGSGEAVSVRSILEIIARETGAQKMLRLGARPRQPNDSVLISASVNRLHREVGFQPRYALSDGIADTVERWRAKSSI